MEIILIAFGIVAAATIGYIAGYDERNRELEAENAPISGAEANDLRDPLAPRGA